MTHLGTQLSALADGQLSSAAADRAMAHIALCPECAEGLASAHAARRVLAAAFEVHPTADLTSRLLALGAQQSEQRSTGSVGQAGQRAADDPAAPWADSRCVPLPVRRDGLPTGGLRGDVRPRRSPVAAMAAGALGVGLVSVLFVLGGEPVTSPNQHPAETLGLLSRAADAAQASVTATVVDDAPGQDLDAGAGVEPVDHVADAGYGWARSVPLPDGYRVAAVRARDGAMPSVEVDLVGPHGVVVVTQTLARLDEDAVGGTPTQIGEGTVLVLSTAPWQAVWQSGDVMVDVVAEVPSAEVVELVAAVSVRAYDDRAHARVVRGWQNLFASWSSP